MITVFTAYAPPNHLTFSPIDIQGRCPVWRRFICVRDCEVGCTAVTVTPLKLMSGRHGVCTALDEVV